MNEYEKKSTGLLHATDELRQLILENPELPLLVFAGEDCNSGDYSYMSCSSVTASIGEFLDFPQTVNDEICFTDRDELEEEIENRSDFTAYIKAEMELYAPYWKPCIIVYVDN